MLVEYTIHVRPLAKLEVLGLKTELTAGSDAVPFGVSGYDAEENEFDSGSVTQHGNFYKRVGIFPDIEYPEYGENFWKFPDDVFLNCYVEI